MASETNSRRSFMKGLVAVLGGAGVMAVRANPAEAGRSRYRGGWGGYRGSYRRYYGGYRGSHRRIYGGYPGYGGFGPPVYNPGFYGSPYVAPAPVVPVQPYYYNNYAYPPFGKLQTPRAFDALSLLEA